jgi:hypothetical protein
MNDFSYGLLYGSVVVFVILFTLSVLYIQYKNNKWPFMTERFSASNITGVYKPKNKPANAQSVTLTIVKLDRYEIYVEIINTSSKGSTSSSGGIYGIQDFIRGRDSMALYNLGSKLKQKTFITKLSDDKIVYGIYRDEGNRSSAEWIKI